MLNSLLFVKLISILLIFITAAIAGIYPFINKYKRGKNKFPFGQALAIGIFLGAGFIHMLGDASEGFTDLHYNYPIAFFIAGAIFLSFLAFEHIGQYLYKNHGANANSFALISFFMLSIHSLFAGAALGLSNHFSVILLLLIAILAHKWAASFALAIQITNSKLSKRLGIILFILFAFMTPIGVYFGSLVSTTLGKHQLITPVFNAIAAGTFIYLGTLHGLSRSFMATKCNSIKNFVFVILGFAIMALVAIWT